MRPRQPCPGTAQGSSVLADGSSAAPAPSLGHRHVWAICILKTGEDKPAFPTPLEPDVLRKTRRRTVAVPRQGGSARGQRCGAPIPHDPPHAAGPTDTGGQGQEPSVNLCLAPGGRVNLAFVKAHRTSFPEVTAAKVSSKGAQPSTFYSVSESSRGYKPRVETFRKPCQFFCF